MKPRLNKLKVKPPTHDSNGRKLTKAPSQDLPMRRFIENVPETEFQSALEASSDPKIVNFLIARASPTYKDESFNTLCRKFGVTLQDVNEIWRNHQLHTGMIQMMTHVPTVLRHVAEDAESKLVNCPRCDGIKVVSTGEGESAIVRTCPVCKGKGEVRMVGDKNAREILFESIGLTGKKSPMVAIQNNNFGLESGLEDVLMNTQRIISGSISSGGDK